MNCALLYELTALETKLYFRHGLAVWWTFILPLAWLAIVAVIVPADVLLSYKRILVPGMCTMVLLSTSLMGVLDYLVDMRESRIYEVMQLQGVSPVTFATACLISRGLLSLLQVVLLFVLACGVLHAYEMSFEWSRMLRLIVAAAFGVVTLFYISTALTQVVARKASARVLATVLFYTFMVLGGLYYDTAWLPGWMQSVCFVCPAYHVDILISNAMFGDGYAGSLENALVLAIYLVLCIVCNMATLSWTHRSTP